MDIFDLSIEEFEKEMKELVNKYTPEELLQELKDCGYESDDEFCFVSEVVKEEKYVISAEIEIDDECMEFLTIHNEKNEIWRLAA